MFFSGKMGTPEKQLYEAEMVMCSEDVTGVCSS